MKKKIMALLLLGAMVLPNTAFAATTNDVNVDHNHSTSTVRVKRATVCPAYEDGHRFYNKEFLRKETKTYRTMETVNGKAYPVEVTETYNVYRTKCACGYYTPSSISRELINRTQRFV